MRVELPLPSFALFSSPSLSLSSVHLPSQLVFVYHLLSPMTREPTHASQINIFSFEPIVPVLNYSF